jgi:putative oxidoreductase
MMINQILKLQESLVGRVYFALARLANKYLFSALVFFMRFWMAKIFWYSGLTKIDNWKSTVYLFKYEYAVPIIPAELAAAMATAIELTAPILLLIGFMTRIAAAPMICMVAVIQFTYLDLIDHLYWAILLCTIMFYGPGRYSLDCLICYKTRQAKSG